MGECYGTRIYIPRRSIWYNNLSNVVPERGFEREAALTVEEVFGQSAPNRLFS